MADTFKNASLLLDSTGIVTIYTVPTASSGVTGTPPVFPTTTVIKSILVCNYHGSTATLVDVGFVDYSVHTSTVMDLVKEKSVAAETTVELLTQPLVLEESDILKVKANAANQVTITVSCLEITKGDL